MAKDFSTMEDSNRSSNPSIHDISQPSRRTVLRGSLGALASNFLAPLGAMGGAAALTACATTGTSASLLGFKSVGISTADLVLVPDATVSYGPGVDITSAVTAELNALVPSVGIVPPAGWQPGQPLPGAAATPATAPGR